MPYIKVWVEEEPCNGSCESADEAAYLRALVDEAIRHLQAADVEAAIEALATGGSAHKTPTEIMATYKTWQAGKLPGFTNYRRPT